MLSSRGGVTGEEAPAEVNPRGRGKIINVASLLSFQGAFSGSSFREIGAHCSLAGGSTVPAYAAAKHGVLGLVSSSLFRSEVPIEAASAD